MSNHQKTIIIIILVIIWVLRSVQGLGQLDGLLQSGIQAMVRLVVQASEWAQDRTCQRLEGLQRLLVSLVECYVSLVKAMLQWHVVVVLVTDGVVVVVVVVVIDIECLHQFWIIILQNKSN